MSVTFAAEPGNHTGFTITCLCRTNTVTIPATTYADACIALTATRDRAEADLNPLGCKDPQCLEYADGITMNRTYDRENGPAVNMSNTNAAYVLAALGYVKEASPIASTGNTLMDAVAAVADDYACGEEDADAFLGRVLMAEAVHPGDPGTDTETTAFGGGGSVTWCGRQEGYLAARLNELREVAEFARTHNARVCWA